METPGLTAEEFAALKDRWRVSRLYLDWLNMERPNMVPNCISGSQIAICHYFATTGARLPQRIKDGQKLAENAERHAGLITC
jgi:hypothetical protein